MLRRTRSDGNGETIELRTGDRIIVEGNVEHQATAVEDSKALDVFALCHVGYTRISTLRKIPKKTAWIVAQYEVFWPTSNFGARPVLTKPRSGNISISRMEDTPAFRDRFQVK